MLKEKYQQLWLSLQLLGNDTGDLFNNVYAITLDELTGLQSLSAYGVEDKIYTSRGRKQMVSSVTSKKIKNKSSKFRRTCRNTSN